MTNVVSSTLGRETEWDEAHSRLKVYLHVLQVGDQECQERIISEVLRRAAILRKTTPEEDLTALAMNEFLSLSERWFEELMNVRERATARGLVSMFAMDAVKRWPAAYLSGETPADFQRALRDYEPRGVPELSVSSMVPQPFLKPSNNGIELANGLASVITKVVVSAMSGILFLAGNRPR